MERGRDPLGELGWDIGAFDPFVFYSVNPAHAAYLPRSQVGVAPAPDGLARRFRNHPDAERVTRRAITYNRMLEPVVAEWQNDLATVRHRMLR